jgi:hypothetical protein
VQECIEHEIFRINVALMHVDNLIMNSEKSEYSENRFEIFFQNAKKSKKKFILIFVILIFLTELFASFSYLSKRIYTGYPILDLIERFYILRPIKHLTDYQYRFPNSLIGNYVGEGSLPKNIENSFQADSLRGYVARPNTVVEFMNYFWSGTNSQGFHITDFENPLKVYNTPKEEDTFRIIILGGSTVAGIGSSDQQEALPSLLQNLLRLKYVAAGYEAKKFEVINGGVGGYYTELELLHYLSTLRQLEPNLVISYNGWNDSNILNKLISNRRNNYTMFESSVHQRNNQILSDYFHFWPTLARSFSLAFRSAYNFFDGFAIIHIPLRAVNSLFTQSQGAEQRHAGSRKVPFSMESVERYTNNIEILTMINLLDGVQSAWFMQPLVGLGNKPPSKFREKAFLELEKNVVEQRRQFYKSTYPKMAVLTKKYSGGLPLCAASLIDVFDGNPDTLYEDSGHLLGKGNKIVAERIGEEMARCGIIERK